MGGAVKGAHLELHDMRFAAGEAIEDCYEQLKAQWWGEPTSLHLDAWGKLLWADGHKITLSKTPTPSAKKLWFVHLGGYENDKFTELHHNLFLVDEDERDAKKRALEQVKGWFSPHKDEQLSIEMIMPVEAEGWHVTLTLDENEQPFNFDVGYIPIGKMKK